MIAFEQEPSPSETPAWHAGFLALLPRIELYARQAFRALPHEAREEAVTDVIANTLCAYRRLAQLGKEDLAYACPLARFAVAHYRAGRRVGSAWNKRDVLSRQAQRAGGFSLESLDARHAEQQAWSEALADNSRSPVPDQAAFRIDFPAWLSAQSRRNQRLVQFLSLGNGGSDAADRFVVSPARISQLRQELRQSWAAFQGEPPVSC